MQSKWLSALAIITLAGCMHLLAEEGRGEGEHGKREGDREHREGDKRREGGEESRDPNRASQGKWMGEFVKGPEGVPAFKTGEGKTYLVVLGQHVHDRIRGAMGSYESELVGKGKFWVMGWTKKDTLGQEWISIDGMERAERDWGRDKEHGGEKGEKGEKGEGEKGPPWKRDGGGRDGGGRDGGGRDRK